MYSQDPIGLHAIAYVLTCAVICRLRTEIFTGHLLTRMTVAAATTVTLGVLAMALTCLAYRQVSPRPLLRQVAFCTIYTTLVSPLAFWAFDSSRRLTNWQAR